MKKLALLLCLLPLFSACLSGETKQSEVAPVALHQHDKCHLCGMVVTKYPGPKGQVHLKNKETVLNFCSNRDMFNFALQSDNIRQIDAVFVHDIAVTDWQIPDDKHFIDATTAWYVYGTSKKAVMGPAVASFSSKAAAEKFAQEFGGAVLTYEQITLALLNGE